MGHPSTISEPTIDLGCWEDQHRRGVTRNSLDKGMLGALGLKTKAFALLLPVVPQAPPLAPKSMPS